MFWFSLLSLLSWGLDVPTLTGRVVDRAQILSAGDQSTITQQLAALETGAGIQAAVLTVDSLEGSDIESYALKVVESWKLGKKGSDKGLLLVVAPKERRMRWEVGYGLEGDLTDAFTKRLIVEQLAPYFKQGNYAMGISSAFSRIAEKLNINAPEGVAPGFENVAPEKNPRLVRFFKEFGFLVILIPIFLLQMLIPRRFRGRSYHSGSGWGGGGGSWGGGSSGGGFSGGGGSFGGGGSSGSW